MIELHVHLLHPKLWDSLGEEVQKKDVDVLSKGV